MIHIGRDALCSATTPSRPDGVVFLQVRKDIHDFWRNNLVIVIACAFSALGGNKYVK